MPVLPSLRSVKQKDRKCKVSLGYITRPSLKKPKNKKATKTMQKVTIYLLFNFLGC
jgi:hypothetical protein